MKLYNHIILLIILISILCYFLYQKKLKQYFTIPISKPNLNIHSSSAPLWVNQNIEKISQNLETYETIFHPSEYFSYTNRSIDNSEDYYVGFYFEITNPISDIVIGLHHTDLDKMKKPAYNVDFGMHFLPDNKIQIKEKFDPYLESEIIKGQHIIQNLSYCFHKNKKCLGTKNTFHIQNDKCFAILIDQNMINYIIVQKNDNNIPDSALLFHQSKNQFSYPLYPVILNKSQDNTIKTFKWCTSTLELPPAEYSVEYISEQKYNLIENSRGPLKQLIRPSESFSPAPIDNPEEFLFPWERKLEITEANIDLKQKILNIKVKAYNITQDLLSKMYGVNILLSVNLPEKKNKVLLIPYIPIIQKNNLVLDSNDIISMSVNISNQLSYFYAKDLRIQVVLRIGEFTSDKNIKSDYFIFNF